MRKPCYGYRLAVRPTLTRNADMTLGAIGLLVARVAVAGVTASRDRRMEGEPRLLRIGLRMVACIAERLRVTVHAECALVGAVLESILMRELLRPSVLRVRHLKAVTSLTEVGVRQGRCVTGVAEQAVGYIGLERGDMRATSDEVAGAVRCGHDVACLVTIDAVLLDMAGTDARR